MRRQIEFVLKATLVLLLAATSGAVRSQAQVNAGPATIEFSKNVFTVRENAGTAAITIKRSGNTNSAVTVNLATLDWSATAGVDYLAYEGPVTIPAGKTEGSVHIRIKDDLEKEDNETVNLTLSNPSADAVLGAQSTAELIITDNDDP